MALTAADRDALAAGLKALFADARQRAMIAPAECDDEECLLLIIDSLEILQPDEDAHAAVRTELVSLLRGTVYGDVATD